MKRIIVSTLFVLAAFAFCQKATFAAANVSLSPGSGNFAQGSTIAVTINVNTGGDAVNAAEVVLNFPADKLKATYISHSGSAFDITAEAGIGNGEVRIAKGKIPPAVVGVRRLVTVGFTALDLGSATISVSGSSSVLRESDSANIFGGGAGATFNITAPAPVVPTEPSSETLQEAAVQPPEIENVEVLNLGYQTASISWKTDTLSDSQVEYGFVTNRVTDEVKYFFTAQSGDLVQDHQIELDPKTLIPGHLYHFRVLSSDAAGNQSASEDGTFVVPGYALLYKVLDVDSNAVSGATVTLPTLGIVQKTDSFGVATFKNLPVGNFAVDIEYKNKIKKTSTDLLAQENEDVIVLDFRASNYGTIGMIVGATALIVFAVWIFWRMKRGGSVSGMIPKEPSGGVSNSSSSHMASDSFPQVS